MTRTIETILSALANSDEGSIEIPLDPLIYPENVVRAFVTRAHPHYSTTLQTTAGSLCLGVRATDPSAARLQIGEALNDLLTHALRRRA